MELNEFRPGNFVSSGEEIAKVIVPGIKVIRIKLRDGTEMETDKIARVFLSPDHFKRIPGFRMIGNNAFVLPGMLGYFKYNYTLYQFEWVVEGLTVRALEYLDEIQNLYQYVVNKNLFP